MIEIRSISIGMLIKPMRGDADAVMRDSTLMFDEFNTSLHSLQYVVLLDVSLATSCLKAPSLRCFHCPTSGKFSLMGFKMTPFRV